jgi:hypothetical protein
VRQAGAASWQNPFEADRCLFETEIAIESVRLIAIVGGRQFDRSAIPLSRVFERSIHELSANAAPLEFVGHDHCSDADNWFFQLDPRRNVEGDQAYDCFVVRRDVDGVALRSGEGGAHMLDGYVVT